MTDHDVRAVEIDTIFVVEDGGVLLSVEIRCRGAIGDASVVMVVFLSLLPRQWGVSLIFAS